MRMLYDSERFVVVHIDANAPPEGYVLQEGVLPRHGFEIVDKTTNREMYLDGPMAHVFQAYINSWQDETPTQEEVEDVLDKFAFFAHTPLISH